MSLKINKFNGIGNVKNFIEKVKLLASLKEYDKGKQAQLLASYLEDAAFDVYMRLSTDDRKDPTKIQTELLKEFHKGQLNREAAIKELKIRKLEMKNEQKLVHYNRLVPAKELDSYLKENSSDSSTGVKNKLETPMRCNTDHADEYSLSSDESDLDSYLSDTDNTYVTGRRYPLLARMRRQIPGAIPWGSLDHDVVNFIRGKKCYV